MSGLPPGWVRVELADVASTQLGRMLSARRETGVHARPYLRNRDVQWGRVNVTDLPTMDFGPADADRFRLAFGDILVCEGGEVGRAAIWRGQLDECYFQKAIHRVRVSQALSPEFLRYLLEYYARTKAFAQFTSGSTIAHLPQEDLRSLPVNLPPRAEQERIVAAIEEEFSRLDAGVAALERAWLNLKRMRAAVLEAAVSGRLVPRSDEDVADTLDRIAKERRAAWHAVTNKPYKEPAKPAEFPMSVPGHWRIASLEAITDPIRVICYGILMPKEHVEDGVPYVRVKDMKGWAIDVAGLKKTSPEIAAKYARASLKVGDLLLAIRGSFGRAAIIPCELDGANITQDSARIASHPDIDHRYLLYYLGGSIANRYYSRVARGVAVKGVNIGDLRAIPVPIPPRQEQEVIADEIERRFTILNNAEMAAHKQIRHSQTLRSSILAAAFSGGLVPQDPTDEPASVLLDRIAAERPSSSGHGPKRGRKSRVLQQGVTA